MGSFANSLHVKCDKASDVLASIESVLRNAGYDTTDEQPGGGGMWDVPSSIRGLYVSQVHNEWVAILDSEFFNSESLAYALSDHLKTFVIQFMVHDSDAWYYQLFHNGEQMDEFDSSGEHEASGSLVKGTPESSHSEAESRNQAYRQRVNEIAQQNIEDAMPDEIRSIKQQMGQGIEVSASESAQLREWVLDRMQQIKAELNNLKLEKTPSPSEMPAWDTDLHPHLEKLRPILLQGTPDNLVLETLGKQDVLAEQTLGEFLDLIGVQQLFASLSYPYLRDCSEEELLAEDIKMIAHLKFEAGAV
jgi:hypothetical protein